MGCTMCLIAFVFMNAVYNFQSGSDPLGWLRILYRQFQEWLKSHSLFQSPQKQYITAWCQHGMIWNDHCNYYIKCYDAWVYKYMKREINIGYMFLSFRKFLPILGKLFSLILQCCLGPLFQVEPSLSPTIHIFQWKIYRPLI